jgi:hypothetical protein
MNKIYFLALTGSITMLSAAENARAFIGSVGTAAERTIETDALMSHVMSTSFQNEGCGICKQTGAHVSWLSPYSMGAHKACYEEIAPAEKDVSDALEQLYPKDAEKRNTVFSAIVGEVQKAISAEGASTIKQYIGTHDVKKLKALYDSVDLNFIIKAVNQKAD